MRRRVAGTPAERRSSGRRARTPTMCMEEAAGEQQAAAATAAAAKTRARRFVAPTTFARRHPRLEPPPPSLSSPPLSQHFCIVSTLVVSGVRRLSTLQKICRLRSSACARKLFVLRRIVARRLSRPSDIENEQKKCLRKTTQKHVCNRRSARQRKRANLATCVC